MDKTTSKDLEKRISALEKQISKSSKPKEKRKPSAYNEFVKKYINKLRNGGDNRDHKELFADAAKEWSKNKKE